MAAQLEDAGWLVAGRRHRGGAGDLLAVHRDGRRWLIECKTDKDSPWANYGPARRQEALDCAKKHDLSAWMCWRAPRQPVRWIPSSGWPPIKGEEVNG